MYYRIVTTEVYTRKRSGEVRVDVFPSMRHSYSFSSLDEALKWIKVDKRKNMILETHAETVDRIFYPRKTFCYEGMVAI